MSTLVRSDEALLERVLGDAERRARAGDRQEALDLLVLALDLSPDNDPVLLRVQGVREQLRAIPARPSIKLPPPPTALVVGRSGAARPPARERGAEAGADAGDGRATDVVAGDEPRWGEESTAEVAREGEPLHLAPRLPTIEEVLRDDPVPVAPRRRAPIGLLLVLLLSAGAWWMVDAGHGVDDIVAAVGSVGQRIDPPAARAERLWAEGNAPAATAAATEAIERGVEPARMQLLLARIALAGGDSAGAGRHLDGALEASADPQLDLDIARLLMERGETTAAADAYLQAFSHGATGEAVEEIAAAQQRAGRPAQAARVRDLARRLGSWAP